MHIVVLVVPKRGGGLCAHLLAPHKQGLATLQLSVENPESDQKLEEAVRLLQWFRRAHVSLRSMRTCLNNRSSISYVEQVKKNSNSK